MNAVHTLTNYAFKIRFNIILPPIILSLPSGLFPWGFPTKIVYVTVTSWCKNVNNKQINSMEQSPPWEADSQLASHIPHL